MLLDILNVAYRYVFYDVILNSLGLLNIPRLFNLTQHRYFVIKLVALTCVLHVSVCTSAILRHVNKKATQRKTQ
jgi:hypothetical protein